MKTQHKTSTNIALKYLQNPKVIGIIVVAMLILVYIVGYVDGSAQITNGCIKEYQNFINTHSCMKLGGSIWN